MQAQRNPSGYPDLHELFSSRLEEIRRYRCEDAGCQFNLRELAGGLHDSAALLGLDALGCASRGLLDGRAFSEDFLREALPSSKAIETRAAEAVVRCVPGPGVEMGEEPAVVLLSRDPALGEALHELPDGRGTTAWTVETPEQLVAAVTARPDSACVLIIDEANAPGDLVEQLDELLERDLRSGRLGIILVVEQIDSECLRKAWRAGFTAVEPRDQPAAALERSVHAVAARCIAVAAQSRVLVVGDDELIRQTCTMLLTTAGMQVDTLEQLEQLREVLATRHPDLILLAGAMDGVPALEIAGMLELCAFDGELGVAFLARAADSEFARERLLSAGFEMLFPADGAARLIARIRKRASRNRAHELDRQRLVKRDRERDQIKAALNQHALVSLTDRSGQIVHANDRFCQVSGYSRDELIGQNHRIINSGAHPPEFFREMWQTVSRGRIWQGTIRNQAKDGSFYWVLSSIVPFVDEAGRPYRYVSIRTDITRLKQTERELSLRSHAIDAASNGIVLVDMRRPDQPVVEVNPAFEAMTGYPSHEVMGRNCRFLQGTDTERGAMKEIRAALAEKRTCQIVLRNYRKNGTPFWNQLTLSPIFGEDDELTHYVGIQNDITGRVEAERAEARARKRLQLGQHYANIGTWDWNIQTGELYWTETIGPLFGHRAGELQTSFDNFAAAIHPDDRQSVLDAVKACIENEEPYAIEHRVVWPDGTVRWLSEHGAVERSESGEPLRMIGVVQDIDERKRALMELMIAREQADRANQAKSEFLSRMSHELRTPMNAVLGFAQLLRSEPALSEDQIDNSEEIIKAGRHLLELINEVLDLSKIESGRIQISIESVSIAPLIDECLSLVKDMAQRHSVSIHQDVSGELAVRADRTRLKQAVLNLLSNAIKYNRPGGRVWLRAEPGELGNGATLSIVDTGTGIAAEKLTRLYEPFERLDAETTGVEGTGIGLTITRRLIDLMGGTIRVRSEPGQGSVFMIDLPQADDILESEWEETGAHGAEPAGVPGPATVLYVEDNPSNIRLMTRALAGHRHINLLTAHSAELGIELAISRTPDLILLDINLPDMDGYEVLGVIRCEASLRRVPVMAISANALPHDFDRARKAGFSEYLTKPLDIDRLLETIARFIPHGEAPEDE